MCNHTFDLVCVYFGAVFVMYKIRFERCCAKTRFASVQSNEPAHNETKASNQKQTQNNCHLYRYSSKQLCLNVYTWNRAECAFFVATFVLTNKFRQKHWLKGAISYEAQLLNVWASAVIVYGIGNCTNWRQTKPFMCNEIRANFSIHWKKRPETEQTAHKICWLLKWDSVVRSIMCYFGNEIHQLERQTRISYAVEFESNFDAFRCKSIEISAYCHMVVYFELRRRLTVSVHLEFGNDKMLIKLNQMCHVYCDLQCFTGKEKAMEQTTRYAIRFVVVVFVVVDWLYQAQANSNAHAYIYDHVMGNENHRNKTQKNVPFLEFIW